MLGGHLIRNKMAKFCPQEFFKKKSQTIQSSDFDLKNRRNRIYTGLVLNCGYCDCKFYAQGSLETVIHTKFIEFKQKKKPFINIFMHYMKEKILTKKSH